MLFILYTFSPVVRVFTRAAQPEELTYLVVFGIVLGGVYPFVQAQISSVRMADYALMGFGYLGVFVAGWYLRTAFLTRKQLRVFYLLGAICVILAFRGLWGFDSFSTDPAQLVLSPDALLIAIAIFLVVKNTLAKKRLSVKVMRPIARLAQLSFGIYRSIRFCCDTLLGTQLLRHLSSDRIVLLWEPRCCCWFFPAA